MPVAALDTSHARAAIALWDDAGLTRPWNDASADFARAVGGPASDVLGLVVSGAVIGTALVGHDGHRGWVYYLAVAPGRRGAGLGRELMSACEDWLQAREIPKLNLMVRTDNTEVAAFYAALGYDPDAVVVLSKRLDGR